MLMVKPLENRAEKKSPHLDPRWEYDKMCLSTGGDAISIPMVACVLVVHKQLHGIGTAWMSCWKWNGSKVRISGL